MNYRKGLHEYGHWRGFIGNRLHCNEISSVNVVCYTAVFSVTQRSSPPTVVSGEERCVTTLKTAV